MAVPETNTLARGWNCGDQPRPRPCLQLLSWPHCVLRLRPWQVLSWLNSFHPAGRTDPPLSSVGSGLATSATGFKHVQPEWPVTSQRGFPFLGGGRLSVLLCLTFSDSKGNLLL